MWQKCQQRTFITQPACVIFRVHPQPSGYLWPSSLPCITLRKSDHASIVCPIIRVLGELAEHPKTGTSQGRPKTGLRPAIYAGWPRRQPICWQSIRQTPLQWVIVALVKALNVVAVEALVTGLHPGAQRAHGRKFLDSEPDRLRCGRKAAIAQRLSCPALALAHEQLGGYAVVECHGLAGGRFCVHVEFYHGNPPERIVLMPSQRAPISRGRSARSAITTSTPTKEVTTPPQYYYDYWNYHSPYYW